MKDMSRAALKAAKKILKNQDEKSGELKDLKKKVNDRLQKEGGGENIAVKTKQLKEWLQADSKSFQVEDKFVSLVTKRKAASSSDAEGNTSVVPRKSKKAKSSAAGALDASTDPDSYMDKVKAAVTKWTQGQPDQPDSQRSVDYSLDRDQELRKILEALNQQSQQSQHTAKTRITSGDTNSGGGGKGRETSKPKRFVDLALLILEKCKDEDLVTIVFSLSNEWLCGKKKSRDELKAKISSCDSDSLTHITFQENSYMKDCKDFNLDTVYSKLERILLPKADLKVALEEAFEKNFVKEDGNEVKERDNDIMQWQSDFVIVEKGPGETIDFPGDLTKGSAVIITGESGSGKSEFARKQLPSMHTDAAFIYHELDDTEAAFDTYEPENKLLADAYQKGLKILLENGYDNTPVYNTLSELSRINNSKRNMRATDIFESLMEKATGGSTITKEWWNNPSHALGKLVIIIDEVGKAPDLARGLVDEVRTISCNIRNKKCADNVMLVLVGSGLDHFIGEDSLDFKVDTNEDAMEKAQYTSFGTDPSKSRVITLKGPNLENSLEICGIPTKDILVGTYSRVLATNTRMLTRGVIPVLKSRFNILRVDDLSSRRAELGSTNLVMDYAARAYIDLNGLSRLHSKNKEGYETLLLNQFKVLMFAEIVKLKEDSKVVNPAFQCSFAVSGCEYESVLRAGLITSDVTGTSKALRYLACKGQTAPLDAQDGIAFEIVLQHHLVRLCQAENDCYTSNIERKNKYFCGRYSLAQAWPPSSSTKDGLITEPDVQEEVSMRYANKGKKNPAKSDVNEIKKILQINNEDCDLVLRQTVSNAQGADVLVLKVRVYKNEDGEVIAKNILLDLYQAKHLKKLRSRSSQETIGAFASLGVCYTAKQGTLDKEAKTGPAGYSNIVTQRFVDELAKEFGDKVQVGRRVVVFSLPWKCFQKAKSWAKFDFNDAERENVWIWTREMLEPTISALVTKTGYSRVAKKSELKMATSRVVEREN